MTPRNRKAPAPTKTQRAFTKIPKQILRAAKNGRKGSKSALIEAQHARILALLAGGPKTSHELRAAGIYQQSTRVMELRRMGYAIATERVNLIDVFGFWHPRCALYVLTPPESGNVGGAAQ